MDPRNLAFNQSDIDNKIDFITRNYFFINWEERPDQFVSQLLGQKSALYYLNKMQKMSPHEYHPAFKIFESRQNKGAFRIVVDLPQLSLLIPSPENMQNLIAFLNHTHCPPEEMWLHTPDATADLPKKWEIYGVRQQICFQAPSLTATHSDLSRSNGVTGEVVCQWLTTKFHPSMKDCGFHNGLEQLFAKTLRTEDKGNSYDCYFEPYDLVCINMVKPAKIYLSAKNIKPKKRSLFFSQENINTSQEIINTSDASSTCAPTKPLGFS